MNTQLAYEKMHEWYTKPIHGPGYDFENGECAYFQDENHKCAVGSILPMKLYDESMEMGGVLSLVDEHKSVARFFENTSLDFLKDAQEAHDRVVWDHALKATEDYDHFLDDDIFRKYFIPRLDSLAVKYNLNVVTT